MAETRSRARRCLLAGHGLRKPVIPERRTPAFCLSCEMAEAVTDERRMVLTALAHAPFLYGDSHYDRHRDCWVTTGNEQELERMLRHVTWRPS